MNHGLSDLMATVTVPKSEYESLIRNSEKLKVLTNYVTNNRFVTSKEMRAILDITEAATDTKKADIGTKKAAEEDK